MATELQRWQLHEENRAPKSAGKGHQSLMIAIIIS